ncbi:thioredoxin [Emiliania huxleyi CCMP1516]|uniref:Thioredoxin domain-containing protein n=2 Tax=Emiliania huxleyi TaxID=2903 RepID=A0A0D3ITI8_EMIH1|nr:thioredoxin [Emiliania huxleyi CCMP1516]EOD14573.1 thioredoxin [Emiliania huxleyi CCMP1516]|eukprot:XP_005767002.1 thioredoxin [Emiliania huxleyi CCMP1516]
MVFRGHLSLLLPCLLLAGSCSALRAVGPRAPTAAAASAAISRSVAPRASGSSVVDISSKTEFEAVLDNAGDALVVVDYSTSWCGPCKIIAPKYDEMSEKYTNVKFLKVMGDASPEADQLMRSQGVRARSVGPPAANRLHALPVAATSWRSLGRGRGGGGVSPPAPQSLGCGCELARGGATPCLR